MERQRRFIEEDSVQRRSAHVTKPEAGTITSLISPIAAVYGANASGKSNFLSALWLMRQMVVKSYSNGNASSKIAGYMPFLLDHVSDGSPAEFFTEFQRGGDSHPHDRYLYAFTFDADQILSEQLACRRILANGELSNRMSLVYQRKGIQISFGPSFKGQKKQLKETIALRPNALVLSAAAAAGMPDIMDAYDFFAQDLSFYPSEDYGSEMPNILSMMGKDPEYSRDLSRLVHLTDTGVSAIKRRQINGEAMSVDMDSLFQILLQRSNRRDVDDHTSSSVNSLDQKQQTLVFDHSGENGDTVEFDLSQESRGTLAALAFLSLALRQLQHQTVILVDEIDSSLHPLLVREFVKLFADPRTNPHHAQLIFTTHDVSLIDESGPSTRTITPDEIWFTEKADDGSSEIFPATDQGIRKGENVGRNYLRAVYGAVPDIGIHEAFAQIMRQRHEGGETPEKAGTHDSHAWGGSK